MRNEGESPSSDSSERSDDNDDDDDGNGAKDNNGYSDGGGDRNTGAGGGSAEWMDLLIPSSLSETFRALAKARASLLTKSRKSEVGKK